MILAFALGLMHGPARKNGETMYFSLSMPNTISMSSDYVKRYSSTHGLTQPSHNIFRNIIERIEVKYDPVVEKG